MEFFTELGTAAAAGAATKPASTESALHFGRPLDHLGVSCSSHGSASRCDILARMKALGRRARTATAACGGCVGWGRATLSFGSFGGGEYRCQSALRTTFTSI